MTQFGEALPNSLRGRWEGKRGRVPGRGKHSSQGKIVQAFEKSGRKRKKKSEISRKEEGRGQGVFDLLKKNKEKKSSRILLGKKG